MEPFEDSSVEQVFEKYPLVKQKSLLEIRQLIFDTHKELSPNENLIESLKWNQPTYTAKEGTPIRIDQFGTTKIAIFFHCQTNLVEQFREQFADSLTFSKNRAIVLIPTDALPINDLKLCIQMGLTYHKKS